MPIPPELSGLAGSPMLADLSEALSDALPQILAMMASGRGVVVLTIEQHRITGVRLRF